MMELIFNESTKKVLSLVYREQPISRKDIAAKTGFSKAAVSFSVDELMSCGMLVETDVVSVMGKSGPKPINLCINNSFAYVVSIFMRLLNPFSMVYDFAGNAVRTYSFSKDSFDEFEELLEESIAISQKAMDDFGPEKILGVSISISGNVENNIVVHCPYYDASKLDVTKEMQQALGVAVYVERDVYNMAYGEHWLGAGKEYNDFITMWIGTGIGSATIINSQLIKGANGLAGEIGFMVIDKNAYQEGPYTLDGFGNFEKKASVRCLEDKYHMSFRNVVELAHSDEKVLKELYAVCDNLAIGLANAVTLLNPASIVVNGRFRYAKELVEEYLEEKLERLCPISCKVEFSTLGETAIMLGGTYYVLNKVLGITF